MLLALAKRERPTTVASTALTCVLLVSSLTAFVAVDRMRWSGSYVAILVGTLLFHEGGHYVAIRIFGYRDLRMKLVTGTQRPRRRQRQSPPSRSR